MTDEVFASCSMDKNIHVHQVAKNSPIYRFKGHSDEVNSIRFDPQNRLLASCSDDCSVRVWSLRPVKGILGIKDDNKIPSEPNTEEDGEIAFKREDDVETSNRADRHDEPLCLILKGHTKEVHVVAWSPTITSPGETKLLASASFDTTARLWDVSTGACLHIINRHTDMVYSLAFQPELGEFLATGSNDTKMCVTRIKDRQLVSEFVHGGSIYEIAWHPTRNQVAVCGKSEVVNVVTFELLSD